MADFGKQENENFIHIFVEVLAQNWENTFYFEFGKGPLFGPKFGLGNSLEIGWQVGSRQVGKGRQVDGRRSTNTDYKIDRLAVDRSGIYRLTGSMFRMADLSTADLQIGDVTVI